MSAFFHNIGLGQSSKTTDESSEKLVNSEMDDLEIPEGEEMPDPKDMKSVIEKVDAVVTDPTPTTPRPQAYSFPSTDKPFDVKRKINQAGGKGPDAITGDEEQETADDPDDDILSVTTDVNRHQRSIDTIQSTLNGMSKRIDMIPNLDSEMRKMSSEVDDMKSKMGNMRSELDQIRQSFNMYQSSTANKIAEVERRAAEKQLSMNPVVADEIIPPTSVIGTDGAVEDEVVDTNRQSESIPKIALQPKVVVKKKANMSDW